MAWLNNLTAKPVLTVDGVSYSSEVENITLSDQSVVNSGAVLTGGSILLAELPGNSRLVDYNKTRFGRGSVVLIDLEIKGQTLRHPRGSLLVIDSTYDPEARKCILSVGCELTMRQLTNNISGLEDKTSLTLPSEPIFTDLSSAVQSEGKFLWVDNQGAVQVRDFFEGDGWGSNKEAAQWVSVRDYTALSSKPLGTGITPPDQIKVTYSWSEVASVDDGGDVDSNGNVNEQDTTDSTYWLEHPANLKRTQVICTSTGGVTTCKDVIVNDAKRTFNVTKTERSIRRYGGPGGSLSSEARVTEGPLVELQGSYFAELYSWQLARNNGVDDGLVLGGLNNVTQSNIEKVYEYGSGGEVLKTIERQYRNLVGAMTQNDWRAGGAETATSYDPNQPPEVGSRGFLTELPTGMYLEAEITTSWQYLDDRTVETSVSMKSSARCNGVGIYPPTGSRVLQNIDATNNGIVTSTRRTSRGGLINPTQPPRQLPGDSTVTKSAIFTEESSKYAATGFGSIEYAVQMPFLEPTDTEASARNRAANFARHIRQLTEGDAAGMRVTESMRDEVFNYYPGMAFSYHDRQEDKLLKLRMNATAWGISNEQAIFSTDGVLIGLSNGTVNIPSNVDAGIVNDALVSYQAAQEAAQEASEDLAEAQSACDINTSLLAAIEAEQAQRLAPPSPDQTYAVTVAEL